MTCITVRLDIIVLALINTNNAMATGAVLLEDRKAVCRRIFSLALSWSLCCLFLRVDPGHVGIGIYRLDIKFHVGMLRPTILRTDPLICPRIISFKPLGIVMSRYNIGLTSQLGHPEAMDNI